MKYLKPLNENFKLVDLGNHNWFGELPATDYSDSAGSHCRYIMQRESETSEKAFDRLDRLDDIFKKIVAERDQEFDAIVHNCKNRNMRPEYCAEIIYHTLFQSRINDLMQRDWAVGGLKYMD